MAVLGNPIVRPDTMSMECLQDTLEAFGRGEIDVDVGRIAELTAELSRRLFSTTSTTETTTELTGELVSPPIGPRFVKLDKPGGEVVFVNVDDVVLVESFTHSERFCYVWVRCDNRPLIVKGDPAAVHAAIHATVQS